MFLRKLIGYSKKAKSLPPAVERVSIIVPVYNALEETEKCIESLIKHTDPRVKIVIANDASPDPRVCRRLQEIKEHSPNIHLIQRTRNLGYTRNVNAAIESVDEDFVLLNSDTQVFSGWLENLLAPLLSSKHNSLDIGTITALSNAAGAFSIPINNQVNERLHETDWDDWAYLLASAQIAASPPVPTGNGFCLYISRKCWNTVGQFDEELFPRGYGEENDFCQRAVKAGFSNFIAQKCFVFHARSKSFGDTKAPLLEQGSQAVRKRHPNYKKDITHWLGDDPVDETRDRFKKNLKLLTDIRSKDKKLKILLIIHSGGGGTKHTNEDLVEMLNKRHNASVLVTDKSKWILHSPNHETEEFSFNIEWKIHRKPNGERLRALRNIIAKFRPDLVHFRHFFGNTPEFIREIKKSRIPVIFSFHDFATVCPTIQLVNESGKPCRGECNTQAGDCLTSITWIDQGLRIKHDFVNRWRERVRKNLILCDAFVVTSPSTRNIVTRNFPELPTWKFTVIPHGRKISPPRELPIKITSGSSKPRILFFGALGHNKGLQVFLEIANLNRLNDFPFELHTLGASNFTQDLTPLKITQHGAYKRDECIDKITEIGPILTLIPSNWHETYCHTLTESWAAGVPALVSDLGALGERMRRYNAGLALPYDQASKWYESIIYCIDNPSHLQQITKNIQRTPSISVLDMCTEYEKVYTRCIL
ncbi:MAG: glycosyltransferase [Opitutales bacterium]